jgi:hypothetical protein
MLAKTGSAYRAISVEEVACDACERNQAKRKQSKRNDTNWNGL